MSGEKLDQRNVSGAMCQDPVRVPAGVIVSNWLYVVMGTHMPAHHWLGWADRTNGSGESATRDASSRPTKYGHSSIQAVFGRLIVSASCRNDALHGTRK